MAVTVDEIRALACTLPRSYEAIVRGRVKFRIGQIVYLAIAADGPHPRSYLAAYTDLSVISQVAEPTRGPSGLTRLFAGE